MNSKYLKAIIRFFVEVGQLKRTPRSGWSCLGIANPESTADHSFRCAVIGYFLAKIEGADAYKVLLMTLFNDSQEARITDLHKMAQRYIKAKRVEDKAFFEQIEQLPPPFKLELTKMRKEYNGQKSKESKIARDADILECLIQAKEYYQFGNKLAEKFMIKAPNCLETKSAVFFWEKIKKSDLTGWWQELSCFER